MMGPHHLNEVFFDGLRVTEADVLGSVDDGWSIVSDVLAFERVGIARYARCERLLPRAVGAGEPVGSPARGAAWSVDPNADTLPPRQAARLPAHRAAGGRAGESTDSAAYRIAVTKLDQDSAEVLMEIVAAADDTAELFRAEVEDHWRYAQASTVSSEASRCNASFSLVHC